uniref:hypothetical protein n=1 Tax=Candidatus Symbiothrix dinenymphae TaxID=467085 RepID=UPI000AEBD106
MKNVRVSSSKTKFYSIVVLAATVGMTTGVFLESCSKRPPAPIVEEVVEEEVASERRTSERSRPALDYVILDEKLALAPEEYDNFTYLTVKIQNTGTSELASLHLYYSIKYSDGTSYTAQLDFYRVQPGDIMVDRMHFGTKKPVSMKFLRAEK